MEGGATLPLHPPHRGVEGFYAPLLAPPEPQEGAWASGDAYKVMIDTRRLLIQWGVILVATGIGVFAFSRQTRRREEKKMEEESEDDTRH